MMVSGRPVTGIGTHANSYIEYELPSGFTTFEAAAALDDGGARQINGEASSIRFLVYTERPAMVVDKPIEGDRTPELTVPRLELPNDLELQLFSAEPALSNPTSIDIDERGRVWVCEVVNYRQFRNSDSPARVEGDRILILEDTNGDAKADKTTVFYQGRDIDSAHGICVLKDRVIVSAGDKVLVFFDRNHDDRPDEKQVLFSGIGGTQHDHGIHAVEFGPDGRLYFNFGNEGHQLKDQNEQPIVDLAGHEVNDKGQPYRQGMVFRCNLDGSHVETLGWNFRNNWEVAVDSFGSLWQSDNDDDGNKAVRINFVMEYGNYGYTDEMTGEGWRTPRTAMAAEIPARHWHLNDPGVVPTLLITGAGAPTGITINEGDLLPPRFRNQMIHADAGPNIVRAYPVQANKAGYAATIENIINGERDQWFRPSDVCVAPDGSLFVADWYDPGVGGHRMQDTQRGRIFRVVPKGKAAGYRIKQPDFSTIEGAIEALRSPNLATRAIAWQTLFDAGDAASSALRKLWQESENPRWQARALWLLAGRQGLQGPTLGEALRHSNPDLRVTGLRAARQLTREHREQLLPVAKQLAHDANPLVRREVAIALRECDGPDAATTWAELARQYAGEDHWSLEALGIGADGRWDPMLAAYLVSINHDIETPAARDIIWRSRSRQTPALLAKLLTSSLTPEASLPHYLRAFDFQDSSAAEPELIKLAFESQVKDPGRRQMIALEALSRLKNYNPAHHPDHRQAFAQLVEASRGTKEFVDLVNRFGLTDQEPELIRLAAAHPADETGVAAIGVLLTRDSQKSLVEALTMGDPAEAAALFQAIGSAASGRSVRILLPIVKNGKIDVARRRAAVSALAKTKPGADLLITMTRDKSLDQNLKPTAAAALHASLTPGIAQAVNELYPLPQAKGSAPLPPIAALAKRRGNVDAGKLVYLESGTCAKCHQVHVIGKNVGPDLTEIGSKLSREAMFESILFPSAGISHNYESYTALLTDGNIVTGLLVSQTSEEVTLKGADGIPHTFKASDLEELIKQDVSLMPADLQKVMSEQDLVNVVEFLMTLKKPGT